MPDGFEQGLQEMPTPRGPPRAEVRGESRELNALVHVVKALGPRRCSKLISKMTEPTTTFARFCKFKTTVGRGSKGSELGIVVRPRLPHKKRKVLSCAFCQRLAAHHLL